MGPGLRGGLDLGRLAMLLVRGEILAVGLDQLGLAFDDKQVFGVFMLGLVGEIEAARDQGAPVDNHDFIVGDGVMGINERGQAVFQKNVQIGVALHLIALVEEDFDIHPAFFGFDQPEG